MLHGSPPCPVYLLSLQKTYGLRALKAAFALRRFLQAERIKLVQTFFESSDLWVGGVAKTIPGMALIWSRRDLGILRTAKHRVAYRLLARMPDRVFAVSEQVRQHALRVDRIPPNRVITVYNGVEVPPTFPERVLNADMLHITALGNLRPVKGFDLLIEAAAVLLSRHPGLRFSIAGSVLDQAYADMLRDRCEGLGIAARVSFLGNVTDVAAHLKTADIFVLPSRSEGFSNAILESMAMGVPVVATKVGGNAEAIREDRSGLIVPPEDVDALAAALDRLVEDSSLRMQFAQAAYVEVRQRFSVQTMLETTASSYRVLIKTQQNH